MQLTPNDVLSVEEIGSLDGNKVSLLRTKGGFYIALGKKRNKQMEEALAAGSHGAIVKYNLEKQYPGYQPLMEKSEHGIEPIVEKHSHFLSEDLRKNGYDIYSIQTNSDVEFQITKHNATLSKIAGNLDSDNLSINELSIPKEFAKPMAGATVEKALSCKVGLKLKK